MRQHLIRLHERLARRHATWYGLTLAVVDVDAQLTCVWFT